MYNWCRRMIEKQPFSLTQDEMQWFGRWFSLDIAERTGIRGRRQKQAMVGAFCTRPVVLGGGRKPPGQLHGSDFSLRVALLIHGWHRTGMSVRKAAEKVAEDYRYFLKTHLGGDTEIDETVRQAYYYRVRKKHPLDVLLESWFWNFLHCCDWIKVCDPRATDLIALDYQNKGRPEMATMFRDFVVDVRQGLPLGRLHRHIA